MKATITMLALCAISSIGQSTSTASATCTPAPGTKLFITKVYHCDNQGHDAIELFNPSSTITFDYSGWYLSDGTSLEQIGIPSGVWTIIGPGQKRYLRQGELGSFTFGLDYDDVLYLYDADLCLVEQIAWWRDDLYTSCQCVTRVPETGGTHTGYSWITSGGQLNPNAGEVRYLACPPDMVVPPVGVAVAAQNLSLAILPNPAPRSGEIVFRATVPAPASYDSKAQLTIRTVSGRLVGSFESGGDDGGIIFRLPSGLALASGAYIARLRVGDLVVQKLFVTH